MKRKTKIPARNKPIGNQVQSDQVTWLNLNKLLPMSLD